ncbi:MAG TPA: DUF3617 domain-containing protein [Sphingomicrobium sp.]
MKSAVCMIASVLALAACNKGPEVDLHNATGNQVVQAVKQSGIMTSDTTIEPGLWQSKVTVQEMNIPGMPPEMAGRLRAMMAERQQRTSGHCVTPEEVKKPKEDFFGGEDKSCHYARFAMGSGKIDIEMTCREEETTRTTAMSGTYTPTSYSMDVSSQGTGGERGGMSMKMHVDSRRVGACSATDD